MRKGKLADIVVKKEHYRLAAFKAECVIPASRLTNDEIRERYLLHMTVSCLTGGAADALNAGIPAGHLTGSRLWDMRYMIAGRYLIFSPPEPRLPELAWLKRVFPENTNSSPGEFAAKLQSVVANEPDQVLADFGSMVAMLCTNTHAHRNTGKKRGEMARRGCVLAAVHNAYAFTMEDDLKGWIQGAAEKFDPVAMNWLCQNIPTSNVELLTSLYSLSARLGCKRSALMITRWNYLPEIERFQYLVHMVDYCAPRSTSGEPLESFLSILFANDRAVTLVNLVRLGKVGPIALEWIPEFAAGPLMKQPEYLYHMGWAWKNVCSAATPLNIGSLGEKAWYPLGRAFGHAIEYYQDAQKFARNAAIWWSLCARRMWLNKDVRKIISGMIWRMRPTCLSTGECVEKIKNEGVFAAAKWGK